MIYQQQVMLLQKYRRHLVIRQLLRKIGVPIAKSDSETLFFEILS